MKMMKKGVCVLLTVLMLSAPLFGINMISKVMQEDSFSGYGITAFAEENGAGSLTVDTTLQLSNDQTSVTWSASIDSTGAEGVAFVHIATYNKNNRLIGVHAVEFSYASGNNEKSGNYELDEDTFGAKLFLLDANYGPMTKEKCVVKGPFAGDDTINVVYIGDSLYAGVGASPTSARWVNQVGAWYEKTYGKYGVTVNNYYKGMGGTTTDHSMLRMFRDVIVYEPDVVYLSYSINDGTRNTRRYMESFVRTLMSLEHVPYIIFTRSAAVNENGTLTGSVGHGNAVAAHYNVPLIDDREAFELAIEKNGDAAKDYFTSDKVHPNNRGYEVIANKIISCMESGEYWRKPTEPAAKLIENSGVLKNVECISVLDSRVTRSAGWTVGNEEGGCVKSTAAGDTLSFSFTGDILAIEYGLNQNAGKIEMYVDGELVCTCDAFDYTTSNVRVCRGKTNPTEGGHVLDLPYGEHNVVLKTVDGRNTTEMRVNWIYNILVGSWDNPDWK